MKTLLSEIKSPKPSNVVPKRLDNYPIDQNSLKPQLRDDLPNSSIQHKFESNTLEGLDFKQSLFTLVIYPEVSISKTVKIKILIKLLSQKFYVYTASWIIHMRMKN